MSGDAMNAIGIVIVAIINGLFLILSMKKQKQFDMNLNQQKEHNTNIDRALKNVSIQVTNDHSTNLRDDITQTYQLVESVSKRLDSAADDVREVRKQTNRLFALDREKDRRISVLEKSYVKKNIPPPNGETNYRNEEEE